MKMIQFFRCCAVLVISSAFTACTEYLSDNTGTGESIGLPSCVNVMNENPANAKSRTGSDLVAPAIHTSTVSGSNKPIYFRYTTTPGIQPRHINDIKTRGTLVTTDNFYDSYSLYTYLYPKDDTWSATAASLSPSYSAEKVLKSRNWGTGEFWPGAGVKCAFIAYAPYDASGLSAFKTSGWPEFHYTVPTDVTSQSDLLVTRNDISAGVGDYGNIDVPGNFYAKDYITFDHACTAIRFAIGKQMAPCTIKKIEIQNVYGEGDYQYQTEKWTNQSTLTTFTLTKDIVVKATDSNRVLNDSSNVFMMIPQKVPAGAIVAVTLNDGAEHVLKARIDDDIWQKGYTVTYYLSTTEVRVGYVLSISPAATTISGSGGNDVLTINSYKETYYGSLAPVPWTASYTYDESGSAGTTVYESTSPAVSAFTASSKGSVTGENVNFTVTAGGQVIYKSSSEKNAHTKALREATDGSCNLAEGKQTANCYVIHAPGHYSFPLVYGNALNANNSPNTNSYGTTSFVDHQGVQITSPYIYKTNGGANVPYDACIVWQDAPHLVTPSSVKLSSDNQSIEFDVERDNICQGNCVIAVRDKNYNIMWSWHIWVTDYALTKTYEVHNNPDAVGGAVISKFMEVPLGYCDADVRVGDELRKFHLTVKQTEEGSETGSVSILQSSGGTYTYGINAPFYQWGRKDPMLPGNGPSANKPYYDNNYTPLQGMSTNDLKDLTLYPYKGNSSNAYGNYSLELWNKDNTLKTVNNNAVHKTIYDPSPAGYVLPKSAAFTGFSTSNVSGGWSNGWNFYCQLNKTGGTIFFPAFGYRDGGYSAVVNVSGYGFFWSAGPSSTSSYARNWYFNSGDVNPQYEIDRAYGFSVRSASE